MKVEAQQKKYKIQEKIERIETYQPCNDCYTQKLIYLGKENDELKFKYWLLSGILHKVSVEKDYVFRLQEDTIYECEGLKFSIHNVNGSTLDYELLSTFTPINR